MNWLHDFGVILFAYLSPEILSKNIIKKNSSKRNIWVLF